MWACLQKGTHLARPHLEVHNIPRHITTKGQLEAEFGPNGNVRKIAFGPTQEGQSPSYAYVHFHTKADLRKAITTINGTDSPFIQLSEIPKDFSEQDLRMWFEDGGGIENIRISGDEMPEYYPTRTAIVIFRTLDDANRTVTHLCNIGLGSLPFKIKGLVTETEYEIPPNAVYIIAESQQNLGLNDTKDNPFWGQFYDKTHPPPWAPQPSERARARILHAGQQHTGVIQRQPAPLQAGPNQQQQRQMQQQGNQQPLQRTPYQLPPPATSEPATAPTLNTEQQHAGAIPKQPTSQQRASPQRQVPPPSPDELLHQQLQMLLRRLQQQLLPPQQVIYQPPQQAQAGPNMQQQQQLTRVVPVLPPQVNRGQYPISGPKYSITQFLSGPVAQQQQLAPPARFTLLVSGFPHYLKDRDVWTIFQENSYSRSLLEAKVQPCTPALTTPHATVTYGLRNDADQAIQNLHMKHVQISPTDSRQIIFTVERYDY